jgi:nucleoside-diphosphate-sugar epimerase
MRLLVLGGTRFLGLRVCRRMLAAGATITLLNRGESGGPAMDGVEVVKGDRSRDDGLDGLGTRRFDAVLDLSGYQSAWVLRSADALRGRVDHYVFVSSGAVYRPSEQLPWAENTPLGPMPRWGAYGENKVASERLLRAAEAEGAFRVSNHRYPFILGPANFVDRESFVLSRLEARRPVLLPGGGRAINQFVYVEDAANGLVAAIERPDVAAGQDWNCAYPAGLTNRGFVELCAEVAGLEAEIVPIDDQALGVDSPVVDLTDVVFPYPDDHYLLDPSKLARELGVTATVSPRRMLEEFAAWWEGAPDHAPRSYTREQRALEQLRLPAV